MLTRTKIYHQPETGTELVLYISRITGRIKHITITRDGITHHSPREIIRSRNTDRIVTWIGNQSPPFWPL